MRFHIDQCVRAMTGFQGQFSPDMEAYWRMVEALYKNCNVMQVPQEHLPLWWMRAVDAKVPMEARIKVKDLPSMIDEPLEKLDMRTKEGRALRASSLGVGA